MYKEIEKGDNEMKHLELMDQYTAVGMAEGFIKGTKDEINHAWQYLIDTGLAWQLQGWFGRQAQSLIKAGICNPAK